MQATLQDFKTAALSAALSTIDAEHLKLRLEENYFEQSKALQALPAVLYSYSDWVDRIFLGCYRQRILY
jgi:hypothetical protein